MKSFALLFAIAAVFLSGCAGYPTTLTMRVDKIWHSGDLVNVDFVHDTEGLPLYAETYPTLEETATVSYLPDDPLIKEIHVGDKFRMSCATDGFGLFIYDETCQIRERIE